MGNGEGSVEWEWGRGKGGHFSDFLLTTILTFPGGRLEELEFVKSIVNY